MEKISAKFDQIASWIIISLFLVLPIFFIPGGILSFQFDKTIIVVYAALVGLFFWIGGRIKHGTISISKNPIILLMCAIPVVALLSALTSGHVLLAFIGQGYEINTVSFLASVTVLGLLSYAYFQSKQNLFYAYGAFFVGFIVVALFQLVRLFGGATFLSFGMFGSTVSNLIGKWSDLSVYAGLTIILAFLAIEFLVLKPLVRRTLYGMIIVGFFFLILGNLFIDVSSFGFSIGVLLGLLALGFYVYILSFHKDKKPLASLVVLALSLVLIFAGGYLSSALSTRFNLSQIDSRPSWSATTDVSLVSMKQGIIPALLGTGPNRFTSVWSKFKSADANATYFWNVDFSYGIGYIPTMLATEGILGLLSWLLFLGAFIVFGFKKIKIKGIDPLTFYFSLSTYIGAIYLWIFSIFNIPSAVTLAFAFMLSGAFLASVALISPLKTKTFSFSKDQRNMLFLILPVVCIILLIVWGYMVTKTIVGDYYIEKAFALANSSTNIDEVHQDIVQAIQLDPKNSAYYRFLVQVDLVHLQNVISDTTQATSTKTTALQQLFTESAQAGGLSITADSDDYQNYLSVGSVFQLAASLGISNAYENGVAAYQKALTLNPTSPVAALGIAELEASHSNPSGAETQAIGALKLKGDYYDAYYFLGQLYFSEKRYTDAIPAFEQSVSLNPYSLTTRYYLAASYQAAGRKSDALDQVKIMQQLSPQDQSITTLVKNLEQNVATAPAVSTQIATSTKATSATSTKPAKTAPKK